MQQILNEVLVLVCCQMMYLFTPYVGDAQTRYMIGWLYLYTVVGSIVINVILFVVDSVRQYKQRKAWRRQRAQIAQT